MSVWYMTSRGSYQAHEVAMVVEAGAFLEPSLEVRMVADQLSARSH